MPMSKINPKFVVLLDEAEYMEVFDYLSADRVPDFAHRNTDVNVTLLDTALALCQTMTDYALVELERLIHQLEKLYYQFDIKLDIRYLEFPSPQEFPIPPEFSITKNNLTIFFTFDIAEIKITRLIDRTPKLIPPTNGGALICLDEILKWFSNLDVIAESSIIANELSDEEMIICFANNIFYLVSSDYILCFLDTELLHQDYESALYDDYTRFGFAYYLNCKLAKFDERTLSRDISSYAIRKGNLILADALLFLLGKRIDSYTNESKCFVSNTLFSISKLNRSDSIKLAAVLLHNFNTFNRYTRFSFSKSISISNFCEGYFEWGLEYVYSYSRYIVDIFMLCAGREKLPSHIIKSKSSSNSIESSRLSNSVDSSLLHTIDLVEEHVGYSQTISAQLLSNKRSLSTKEECVCGITLTIANSDLGTINSSCTIYEEGMHKSETNYIVFEAHSSVLNDCDEGIFTPIDDNAVIQSFYTGLMTSNGTYNVKLF